jgi:hypothetical protein
MTVLQENDFNASLLQLITIQELQVNVEFVLMTLRQIHSMLTIPNLAK